MEKGRRENKWCVPRSTNHKNVPGNTLTNRLQTVKDTALYVAYNMYIVFYVTEKLSTYCLKYAHINTLQCIFCCFTYYLPVREVVRSVY